MNRHTINPYVMMVSPRMQELAASVARLIQQSTTIEFPQHLLEFKQFHNGEWFVQLPETVRRQHVFFFHPLQHPSPSEALMQMLIVNDALMRASVAGITLVIPYIPYMRQDRKHEPRVPISARLVADLIESNQQVERVITVDLHADQEQGFFKIPVDNVTSIKIVAAHVLQSFSDLTQVHVVSPDFGSAVRSRRLANKLDVPVSIFEKRRPRPGEAETGHLIGEPVSGKHVIMFDDMIDTGGSILSVMHALDAMHAQSVSVYTTHGIFSAEAEQKFSNAKFRVYCTDSIPRSAEYRKANASWLTMLSLDTLLADTVYQASLIGGSVSKLMQ